MNFITEGDLRDLYKNEPFTTYDLDTDTRLTPGARQFLADRGIYIFDNDSASKSRATNIGHSSKEPDSRDNWRKLKLYSKMKSSEALFLLTVEELLSRDVCLAQDVIKLNKQFSCIKNGVKDKGQIENLCCGECTGINESNFSDSLEDCFEITEFHLKLAKRREILILHRLRCALQEIEPVVLELCIESKGEKREYEDILGKINQIINSLSQLICSEVGGKKCLK
ncbi:cobalamin adenosyltransferase [Neobacillus sp. LXY-4]|uniref:cobalamin adenosyltransferase n=1 Tax=Neobacillus sp. LXY-4 TaxID=3379826 RepID=UPI003EE26207